MVDLKEVISLRDEISAALHKAELARDKQLVIGVDNQKRPLPHLEDDCVSVARYFRLRAQQPDHVTVRINTGQHGKYTKAMACQDLRKIFATESELIVVYLAGHTYEGRSNELNVFSRDGAGLCLSDGVLTAPDRSRVGAENLICLPGLADTRVPDAAGAGGR